MREVQETQRTKLLIWVLVLMGLFILLWPMLQAEAQDIEQPNNGLSSPQLLSSVVIVAREGLNFRVEADTKAEKVVNDLKLQTRDTAVILEGPVQNDGYTWWKMLVTSGELVGNIGWSAIYVDGFQTIILSSEFEPHYDPAVTFSVGGYATVFATDEGLYLNTECAGTETLSILPAGSVVQILSGPTEANGYVCYEVAYQDEVGFLVIEADGLHTLIPFAG